MNAEKECPYKIRTASGGISCFNPWFASCVDVDPEILHTFCEGKNAEFLACAYYQMFGTPKAWEAENNAAA